MKDSRKTQSRSWICESLIEIKRNEDCGQRYAGESPRQHVPATKSTAQIQIQIRRPQ